MKPWHNKSTAPTAICACRLTVAVHFENWRCLSFFVRQLYSLMSFRINSETAAQLVSLAGAVPANLEDVLRELGAGDHRFSGTSFGRGECDLQSFLQECRDSESGRNIPADKVPQSTYCLVIN